MSEGRGDAQEPIRQTSEYAGANPYTVEGEIDGLARFATGLRKSRPGPKRNIGVLFIVAAVMFPFFAGTIQLIVTVLKAIF